MQTPTEVFAVDVLSDECGSPPVKPEQCFLAEWVYVENTGCSRTELVGDPNEFLHPFSRQPSFEDEQWMVFASWQCDSQHAYS
jgi:hypothetical protein